MTQDNDMDLKGDARILPHVTQDDKNWTGLAVSDNAHLSVNILQELACCPFLVYNTITKSTVYNLLL